MNPVFKIIVVFCLFVTYCCSNAQKENTIMENNKDNISFSTDSGLITLNGKIADNNGQFVLDNGTKKTIIDSVFFFANFDVSRFQLQHFEKLIRLYEYTGEISIDINGNLFEIKEFQVTNLSRIGINSDAIIGYDVLKTKVFSLNFITQKMKFCESYSDSNYFIIPFIPTKDDYLKKINVSFFPSNGQNGKTGKFIFDLGGGSGRDKKIDALFKHNFINSLKKDIKQLGKGSGKTIRNEAQSTQYQLDSAEIAGICVKPIMAVTFSMFFPEGEIDPIASENQDNDCDGFVGWHFFRDCEIIVDFKQNLLLIRNARNE